MKKVGRVFGYIVLAIGAFLSLFPFYFMYIFMCDPLIFPQNGCFHFELHFIIYCSICPIRIFLV